MEDKACLVVSCKFYCNTGFSTEEKNVYCKKATVSDVRYSHLKDMNKTMNMEKTGTSL